MGLKALVLQYISGFVKKGTTLRISNFMAGRVGINNLATTNEISLKTKIKEKTVRDSIRCVKTKMRKEGLFLRNGRIWIDKENNFYIKRPKGITCKIKSGYFVVRLDKSFDIFPPENIDFNYVVRHFGHFIDLLRNVDMRKLTREQRKELLNMEIEIARAIVSGGRKYEA